MRVASVVGWSTVLVQPTRYDPSARFFSNTFTTQWEYDLNFSKQFVLTFVARSTKWKKKLITKTDPSKTFSLHFSDTHIYKLYWVSFYYRSKTSRCGISIITPIFAFNCLDRFRENNDLQSILNVKHVYRFKFVRNYNSLEPTIDVPIGSLRFCSVSSYFLGDYLSGKKKTVLAIAFSGPNGGAVQRPFNDNPLIAL